MKESDLATDRFYLCSKCNKKSSAGLLFDCLFEAAAGKSYPCAKCDGRYELHISFAYGLDATGGQCIVLDVFLPDDLVRWSDKSGREVTFYPFLVITGGNGGDGAWLPYWHVVRGNGVERKKYGQWAPSMDLSTFEELVAKARAKGYLSLA